MTALLQTPNNILALEYLQALRDTGSAMQPLTISRLGAGYHEVTATGSIASATGIRQRLVEGQPVEDFLPVASADLLQQALVNKQVADSILLHQLLLGQIFRGRDDLQKVYQVEEGLDRRLADAALESTSWDDLVDRIKVRQLTRTRVQRILCYVLNAVPSAVMADAIETGPLYLHLLGCSDRGRRFLSSSRKQRSLPLIANFSRVYATLKRFYGPESGRLKLALAMLELDLRATRNYSLLLPGWSGANRSRDFFQEVLSD